MLSTHLKRFVTRSIDQVRHLNVGLVGSPFSGGQRTDGTELAPRYFRKFGLKGHIERLGHKVTDYGDIDFQFDKSRPSAEWSDLKMNYSKDVFRAATVLSAAVQQVLKAEQICVNLGGDHSLGLGSVHGTAQVYPDISVLWIDAHADVNTFETTESQNAHGMPLSFLIRELYDAYNRKYIESRLKTQFEPCVSANRVAYIGLRDVEEGELKLLQQFGIAHYSMRQVDDWGIQRVVQHALNSIDPNHNRSLHVSLDIDSIDGPLVPNTVLPTVGGLSAREVIQLGELIHSSNRLRTLDIVEINPLIGDRSDLIRTFDLANNLILAFLGKQRQQLFARFA